MATAPSLTLMLTLRHKATHMVATLVLPTRLTWLTQTTRPTMSPTAPTTEAPTKWATTQAQRMVVMAHITALSWDRMTIPRLSPPPPPTTQGPSEAHTEAHTTSTHTQSPVVSPMGLTATLMCSTLATMATLMAQATSPRRS